MRRFLGVALVALSLGGCATDPTTGQPTINQQELANVEVQIQQTAASICKFVPTVASVASVIATYVAAGAVVDIVNAAATDICAAVAAVPTAPATIGKRTVRRLAGPASVNGAPINGYFLK